MPTCDVNKRLNWINTQCWKKIKLIYGWKDVNVHSMSWKISPREGNLFWHRNDHFFTVWPVGMTVIHHAIPDTVTGGSSDVTNNKHSLWTSSSSHGHHHRLPLLFTLALFLFLVLWWWLGKWDLDLQLSNFLKIFKQTILSKNFLKPVSHQVLHRKICIWYVPVHSWLALLWWHHLCLQSE